MIINNGLILRLTFGSVTAPCTLSPQRSVSSVQLLLRLPVLMITISGVRQLLSSSRTLVCRTSFPPSARAWARAQGAAAVGELPLVSVWKKKHDKTNI